MHLDSQSTSPASQASKQAATEACAEVRLAVAVAVAVPVVDWAEAKTANAPATMILVKRILGGCKRFLLGLIIRKLFLDIRLRVGL